jgi:N-acetylmuramoyl-L-alanine amidase
LYTSWQGSVDDHTVVLKKSRYSNIWGVLDFATVVRNIQKDGYANDPEYANKLIKIYNAYNLGQYDIGTASPTNKDDNKETKPAENPAGKILWTVQTGAFKVKANAEALRQKLIYKGFKDAFIVYTVADKLYRVQLGAFSVKDNAMKLQNELKAKKIDSFIKQK